LRQLTPIILFFSLFLNLDVVATASGQLNTDIEFGFEFNVLDGVTLGSDTGSNKLLEQDLEIELDLEYRFNDQFNLFFTGAVIDETEQIKSVGSKSKRSGLEFREIGIAYLFGDIVDFELKLGRVEYESISQWWSWWDDELDIISLQFWYEDLEAFIAIAEQQAAESTDEDFIDPEMDKIQRLIFSMSWEILEGQVLNLYYLNHQDNSPSYRVGDFTDMNKIDDEDADLRWKGISYVAELEHHTIGEIDFELHFSKLAGKSVIYELEDSVAGSVQVSEQEREEIDASARGYLLRWTPRIVDEISFMIAAAKSSGDTNPDDKYNKAYRQTGLQGDLESYGKLFQPELSNLIIDMYGFQWRIAEDMSLAVMYFDYKQEKLSDEIRNASIEVDPSGTNRDLGRELDLIFSLEYEETLEFMFTYAKFRPGVAYRDYPHGSPDYIGIDFVYKFH
jgi:hypothetical protein